MPRAPTSKSKGTFVNPAAGPVPISRGLWGARTQRGHGGLSGEEGVGAEQSSPRLWVPRASLKDPASEFSSRKLKITSEEILNLWPAGRQGSHFQIQPRGPQAVPLYSPTRIPGPACHTHVPGPLHKPSEAES